MVTIPKNWIFRKTCRNSLKWAVKNAWLLAAIVEKLPDTVNQRFFDGAEMFLLRRMIKIIVKQKIKLK